MEDRFYESSPFNEYGPTHTDADADSDVNCRYVLEYAPPDTIERHECWLMDWILEWIARTDVRTVNVDPQENDATATDRRRIVIGRIRHCRPRRIPESHRRLLERLDERVEGLTARCDPSDEPTFEIGPGNERTVVFG